MLKLLGSLKDKIQGKVPKGHKRSGSWPKVRKAHLKANPVCAVCGGDQLLEVHHKMPFHLDPSMELDPGNLITLCESKKHGVTCHLFVGHLGNYKKLNPHVAEDAALWFAKLKGNANAQIPKEPISKA